MDTTRFLSRWAPALMALALLAGCVAAPVAPPAPIATSAPAAPTLSEAQAREIAAKGDCAPIGPLGPTAVYNENSSTWWIDISAEKPGCAPACVVSAANQTSEVNWRCTGLAPAGGTPEPAATAGQAAGTMTEAQARDIAATSDCVQAGPLGATAVYNDNSNTWWIDLNAQKPGCAPACVVDAAKQSAEINWRCTGLSQGPKNLDEARALADQSVCTEVGPLKPGGDFNPNSRTYWIDIDTQKPGCAPACVISADNGQTEVNWRCTGGEAAPVMTEKEARLIAAKGPCAKDGQLNSGPGSFNSNSQTWWFDLANIKAGCDPACVVSADKTSEVNWRCTGATEPGATPAKP